MKTNSKIASLVTAAMIAVSAMPVFAAQNAEDLARGFLLTETATFQGSLSARNMSTGKWSELGFVMTTDLMITNFSSDGTNIPLTKPLPGLPVPTNGWQDINLNIIGLDKDGNRTSQGYMYTNVFLRGDLLAVTITPEMPPVFIPFRTKDPGVSIVIIGSQKGYSSYYDTFRGGFIVWLYGETQADYKILDGKGNVLGQDTINVFKDSTPTQATAVINVNLAGNIGSADLSKSLYRSWNNQSFDSTVTRGIDENVPAKVYAVRGINRQRMYIWVTSGVKVEVRYPDRDGLVPLGMLWSDEYSTQYYTDSYLDSARITILPDSKVQKFDLQISR